MTNEQLRAFIAVAEQGSFRQAAKTIFKTQAAISVAVKNLEEEFDILLFDRDQYRPTLTEAGKAFYKKAKQTVSQFEFLEEVGHQLAKGFEPFFNIVISATFPLPDLFQKLKPLVDQFPYTQFNISTEVLQGVAEKINSQEADLAFGPEFGLTPVHERVQIAEVSFINVAASDFFPLDLRHLIQQEEVRRYPQIIIKDTAKRTEKSTIYVSSNGKNQWMVDDFQTKKELLVAGLGWGRMPQHLIQAELETKKLIPIQVEGIPTLSKGQLFMFRLRGAAKGPVANRIWELLS